MDNPTTFIFEDFSYTVVRTFFDQLHGIQTNSLEFMDCLELMAFCNHQGQIDLKSDFETRLYDELLYNTVVPFDKIKDPKQLCFIWLFLRLWGPLGKEY